MKIVNYPHPALRVKARPVTTIDKEVQLAAGGMLELMYRHEGLGLAAQQVALDFQMIVINFAGDPEQQDKEVVAINPVILEQKSVFKDREGCLSFPGLYQDIRRAKTVRVQAYNLRGEPFEMVCSDLAARIWQHEIDHLNGVLFIDKMGPLARMGSKKMLEEFIAEFEEGVQKGTIPPGTEMKL
ncbi:peptide deformylase [Fimbriiglobus ruber]|uniref:Peptide deformylase n=1 Tax=Fimbriiglobus ruber TaxID=1908690 RepID=A0A225E4P4_9BACT|nr:peptide deformylase [Fimbriiglobus ruber]OWK43377.1 Peptide deformylase [Fimbriiglobus ruber]